MKCVAASGRNTSEYIGNLATAMLRELSESTSELKNVYRGSPASGVAAAGSGSVTGQITGIAALVVSITMRTSMSALVMSSANWAIFLPIRCCSSSIEPDASTTQIISTRGWSTGSAVTDVPQPSMVAVAGAGEGAPVPAALCSGARPALTAGALAPVGSDGFPAAIGRARSRANSIRVAEPASELQPTSTALAIPTYLHAHLLTRLPVFFRSILSEPNAYTRPRRRLSGLSPTAQHGCERGGSGLPTGTLCRP